MNSQNKPYDIVLSDIWAIIKRKKRPILYCSIGLAALSLYMALDRDVLYFSEATFRDKGKADAGMRQTMADYIFGSASEKNDSEAVSAMKSVRLMESVIKKLHMQGTITEKRSAFPFFEKTYKHVLSEWAFWTRRKVPILDDPKVPLVFQELEYRGEIPIGLSLTFTDETHFVLDNGRKGSLNEWISMPEGKFILSANDPYPLTGKTFDLSFQPLGLNAKNLSKNIIANQDVDDRSLIKLKYFDQSRKRSSELVNSLMANYEGFLEKEHDRINEKQLSYLKKREKEMEISLKNVMEQHAEKVEKDLASSGFTDTKKELEFLTHQLLQANQKAMEIDLEKKRLVKLLDGEVASFDAYNGMTDAKIINEILTQTRELKKGQDALDLALKDEAFDETKFLADIRERELLKKCCLEADEAIVALGQNKPVPAHLLNNPKYLLHSWNDKLKEKKRDPEFKNQYQDYLSNLKRLFEMQISAIDERLYHRTSESKEFQGVTLVTGKDLYLNLTKDRQELEGVMRQMRFVLDQIDSADFELSSLTTVLSDPISLERVSRGAQIALQLKDEANRSTKELERLREELKVQKAFLKLHLAESLKLLELKESLLAEKDIELKKATLDMTHREITLLNKQLKDFIETRLVNLDQEKGMIADHQAAIREKMAKIPEKWIHEQLLEQHLIRNQRMSENIAGMVESKNISSNLELIQSSPLDFAGTPLFPKNPHLIIWSLIGLFGGAFLSSLFFISQGLVSKIPLTSSNLPLNGFTYAGSLKSRKKVKVTPLYENNLDTLRRASEWLPESPKTIGLLPGRGTHFQPLFASILKNKGKKCLLLQISDSGEISLKDMIARDPKADIENDTVHIKADRYDFETLTSSAFFHMLETFEKRYDYILVSSESDLGSATAHAFIQRFNYVLLGLSNEDYEEMKDTLNLVKEVKKPIIFMTNNYI